MSLPPSYRPRLASKVRLRWDRREGKELLLYPERGLLLNAVAGTIARLCDGTRTSAEIIAELIARYPAAEPGAIERDAAEFLGELRARGLLDAVP